MHRPILTRRRRLSERAADDKLEVCVVGLAGDSTLSTVHHDDEADDDDDQCDGHAADERPGAERRRRRRRAYRTLRTCSVRSTPVRHTARPGP